MKRSAAEVSSDVPSVVDDVPAHAGRRAGYAYVPWRVIGDTSPEKPTEYPKPEEWPAYVQAAMKRRGDKPIRLYADGIFDLSHYGHFRALEQAKKSFPNAYLMVGVCNDELTHRLKGQTVFSESERYESMRHCKWVDEVIPNAPWVISDAFLEQHDIDFVCHDALPYVDTSGAAAGGDCYQHLRDKGRFHETQRTDGVSTTDLIMRIIIRYDDFVRRNLARGITAKDMGVNPIKGASLKLAMGLEKAGKEIEKGAATAAKGLHALSEAAEGVQYDFLRLFGKEGPLSGLFGAIKTGLSKRGSTGSLTGSPALSPKYKGAGAADSTASSSTAAAAGGGGGESFSAGTGAEASGDVPADDGEEERPTPGKRGRIGAAPSSSGQ